MKLYPSVSGDYFERLSPEACVEALLESGFHHMELGITHAHRLLVREGTPEQNGRAFRLWCEDRGFFVLQGHLDLSLDPTVAEDRQALKRHLELYQGLGIPAAVLHALGNNEQCADEQLQLAAPAVAELAAGLSDTVLCLENLVSRPLLRTPEGLMRLIEAAGGGDRLGVCLDIGHLHRARCHGLLRGNARDFITLVGDRLKALHVHDNMGDTDDHLLPFLPNGLNWRIFLQALEESGYRGLFNYEIHGEAAGADVQVCKLKLRYARQLADYLCSEEFLRS